VYSSMVSGVVKVFTISVFETNITSYKSENEPSFCSLDIHSSQIQHIQDSGQCYT
jgi:hypothetical protein